MGGTGAQAHIDQEASRRASSGPRWLLADANGASRGGAAAGRGSGSGVRPSTRESRHAIFGDAVEILARELSRPVRVEDVARCVSTSPRQLQRVFADVGGLGFRSYLRGLRMSRAAELLAGTDVPVKEVARRVGYRDAGQFSRAFRRTHGLTPSEWRARRRDADERHPDRL